jgi:lincosamide nucleotidyltransferase A/C/D/E
MENESNPTMKSPDVLDLYNMLQKLRIPIWIDGGWGVDALLGKETRIHKDLDIAIEQKHITRFRALMEARGYREIRLDIARPHNFVLGDDQGHEVDVHVIVLDHQGNGIYGPAANGEMYPAASLTGSGTIDGQKVTCISPEWAIKFHSGYELKAEDFEDVSALCEKFGIELPAEYERFKKN